MHENIKAVYKSARRHLCNVSKLADVALFAANHSQNKSSCSQTARLGFEALTGGINMTEMAKANYFLKTLEDVQPELTDKPSVTYVSLTNDASNLFADESGHRFLVLQCYGQFRVIQANNGEGCRVLKMGFDGTRKKLISMFSVGIGVVCCMWSVVPLYRMTLQLDQMGCL